MDNGAFNITNLTTKEFDMTQECVFQGINNIGDLVNLFTDPNCYRHSVKMGLSLFLSNLLIFIFGLFGNFMVIYVVIWRMKTKTASSIFILNLAVADLLVIVGCIPATLLANLIIPWFMGEVMCKIVAYGQGVSVFSAVYSLVAISFDRFRAIHKWGYPVILTSWAYKIVGLIWALGLLVTIPWAIVFHVVQQPSGNTESSYFPHCTEVWETTEQELSYFIIVHVFACYILPLAMIVICDVIIWKNVRQDRFVSTPSQLNASASIQEIQRKRRMRMLKMFTSLTLAFFLFWLPLYAVTLRVKIVYTKDYPISPIEQQLVSILVPISQLLGSCNSCVNPVLYALLNKTFRESFIEVFTCMSCSMFSSRSVSVSVEENNISNYIQEPKQKPVE